MNEDRLGMFSYHWSLEDDCKLLQRLRDLSGAVLSKTRAVADAMEELEGSTSQADVGLRSTVNEFLMLANRQFFENRVYDEDEQSLLEDVGRGVFAGPTAGALANDTEEEQEVSQHKEAVYLGLQSLRAFIQCKGESDGDGTMVDIYNSRPLPYVIGSRAFRDSADVGLGGGAVEERMSSLTTMEESRSVPDLGGHHAHRMEEPEIQDLLPRAIGEVSALEPTQEQAVVAEMLPGSVSVVSESSVPRATGVASPVQDAAPKSVARPAVIVPDMAALRAAVAARTVVGLVHENSAPVSERERVDTAAPDDEKDEPPAVFANEDRDDPYDLFALGSSSQRTKQAPADQLPDLFSSPVFQLGSEPSLLGRHEGAPRTRSSSGARASSEQAATLFGDCQDVVERRPVTSQPPASEQSLLSKSGGLFADDDDLFLVRPAHHRATSAARSSSPLSALFDASDDGSILFGKVALDQGPGSSLTTRGSGGLFDDPLWERDQAIAGHTNDKSFGANRPSSSSVVGYEQEDVVGARTSTEAANMDVASIGGEGRRVPFFDDRADTAWVSRSSAASPSNGHAQAARAEETEGVDAPNQSLEPAPEECGPLSHSDGQEPTPVVLPTGFVTDAVSPATRGANAMSLSTATIRGSSVHESPADSLEESHSPCQGQSAPARVTAAVDTLIGEQSRGGGLEHMAGVTESARNEMEGRQRHSLFGEPPAPVDSLGGNQRTSSLFEGEAARSSLFDDDADQHARPSVTKDLRTRPRRGLFDDDDDDGTDSDFIRTASRSRVSRKTSTSLFEDS